MLILAAFAASAIAVLGGLASALYYTERYALLMKAGVTLQHLRPIHETFGTAWIFLAGVAVVYDWLFSTHPASSVSLARSVRWILGLWGATGVGILASLLSGRFTGREYLGFSPVFSVPILAGWILFAWTFFSRTRFRFRDQPVYVYMWSASLVLFAVTFLEGHLYLLETVSLRPVRDIAIQWKSYGPLVGSFNLLAYGSVMYVSERVSMDSAYVRSPLAFSLFYVGLLNSFTNYGHHTYHLPQSVIVHWTSFLVSMLEILILAKVCLDLLKRVRARTVAGDLTALFMTCVTFWTFALLVLAIAISVPPLNTLIHGTHIVTAHAMGSMLGIDSMIFWACISHMVGAMPGADNAGRSRRGALYAVLGINFSMAVFLAAFLANGWIAGSARYLGPSAPDRSLLAASFPSVMVTSGAVLAASILSLQWIWWRALQSAVRQRYPSQKLHG